MVRNTRSIGRLRSGAGLLGSKRVQIALLLAAVVFSAGCMGGSGGGSGDAVDSVPADVDGVMYFDGAIATDQATTELMNGLIEQSDQEIGPDEPSTWDEALEEIESESDLSIEDFQSATVFFRTSENLDTEDVDEEYGGVIVKSDWTWDEIVSAADAETDDIEEQTYNGVTVYVDSTEGEEGWVADFGDGTFAFGSEAAVKDTIDTREGDAEAFGGDLREAYDDAGDGLMKGAIDLSGEDIGANEQFVPDVQIMTMQYSTDGSEMEFGMDMTVGSEQEAQQFAGTINTLLDGFAQEDQQLSALIENLEIANDGDRITFDYTTTTDELLDTLEGLDSGESGGFGAQQPAIAG